MIHSTDHMTEEELRAERAALNERARKGQLTPHQASRLDDINSALDRIARATSRSRRSPYVWAAHKPGNIRMAV